MPIETSTFNYAKEKYSRTLYDEILEDIEAVSLPLQL